VAGERLVEVAIHACGYSSVVFIVAIFGFLVSESWDFLVHRLDLAQFLGSPEWVPQSQLNKRYGAFALILGTASVTTIAMLLAVPLGIAGALFVGEFCEGRLREGLKVVIELLAAIPSVVWGFVGLVVLNPLIIEWFDAPMGLNALNGGVLLALMSLPVIVSIGEDALRAVPDSYREAAEAMGATRWQVSWRVVVPAARNGLLAAVLLGAGRAVGETMAVLMATGHAITIPTSPLDSVRTLTATIASELGETSKGSDHYQALFVVGLLLFAITFTVNLVADLVVRGTRRE
jgi:phosphate transport system permease protein